jgi:hypothetical protein
MALPGIQTFPQTDLDNLSDAEILVLLKGCGVRVPPAKVPPPVTVYRANLKDGK